MADESNSSTEAPVDTEAQAEKPANAETEVQSQGGGSDGKETTTTTPAKSEEPPIICVGAIEKLVLANDDKGKKYIQYGFIRCSADSVILANEQIFFHVSEVVGSSEAVSHPVSRGQKVKFVAQKDENWGGKDKYKATKIEAAETQGSGKKQKGRPQRPRPSSIDTPRNFGSGRSPKSAPTATLEDFRRKGSGPKVVGTVGTRKGSGEIIFPSRRWRPTGSRDNSPRTPVEMDSPKSPGNVRIAKGPDKKTGFTFKRSVTSQ